MKQIFHIANGDHLATDLRKASIGGEVIVCREALISGPLQSGCLESFWEIRSRFVSEDYQADEKIYYRKTVPEFEKIINIPENSEINLWFEDDLFCQTNMWFCIFLLPKKQNLKIYRVFPPERENEDHWKGFSLADISGLKRLFEARLELDEKNIRLANDLWNAYKNNDQKALDRLSQYKTPVFRHLREVIDAYLNTMPENDGMTNPEIYVKNLTKNGIKDFNVIFERFQKELGIYGYGDLQVKKLYEKAISKQKNPSQ